MSAIPEFCARLLVISAIVVVCPILAACSSGGPRKTASAVPTPAVVGPIPSTSTDYAFIADGFGPEPPVPPGYEEAEYFVSGRANLYEYTAKGVRVVTPCPASAGPLGCRNLRYTTRMLVKRPRDPQRFSGTVVIEPFNPSSGYDIANVWDRSWPYFVRHGDIFVGWTSRYASINALKQFEPRRYAALTWGQSGAVDDGITFDIAAQIGALFKRNRPGSPIHGLKVRHVFEAGFSQDGGFTFTQADVFNAIDRLPGGGPVYDGYIPGGTTGPVDINFGLTPAGSLAPDDPRNRMRPRDSPVIQINTETDVALFGAATGLAYRRPDSDSPQDRYRLWEVPGASHISNDLGASPMTEQRDLAELEHIPLSALPSAGCTHQQFENGPWVGVPGVVDPNPYPFSYIANAAFADLTTWVDDGTPPPRAARIKVAGGGSNGGSVTVARDRFDNALGGLRTPFVDVPTATYSPSDSVSHDSELSGLCELLGYSTPFSLATLQSLYASHNDYLARVTRESNNLVRARFWLASDAEQVVQQAAHADVP
jgi:hypothetical protein